MDTRIQNVDADITCGHTDTACGHTNIGRGQRCNMEYIYIYISCEHRNLTCDCTDIECVNIDLTQSLCANIIHS